MQKDAANVVNGDFTDNHSHITDKPLRSFPMTVNELIAELQDLNKNENNKVGFTTEPSNSLQVLSIYKTLDNTIWIDLG